VPPPAYTPIWLAQTDLENAMSVATVTALFDDGDGVVNTTAIGSVIKQAENEVLSWLGDYGPPPFTGALLTELGGDAALQSAALEFAKLYSFDRDTAYVRTTAKAQEARRVSCDERMQRYLDARQRPPTATAKTSAVGGAVKCSGPTIYLDNEGDY
jgi:hypothetical protein